MQSAVNDRNDYTGPGSGYRVSGERWHEMQAIRQAKSPLDFVAPQVGEPSSKLVDLTTMKVGTRSEVVVAVGPAFNRGLTRTIGGLVSGLDDYST